MVLIQMTVAESVHKLPDYKVTLLGHHMSQEAVGGNIERNPQKQISTALIKLTEKPTIGHIELEQAVAGRQRHAAFPGVILGAHGLVWQFSRVPGSHDMPAGVRFGADLFNHLTDLVHHPAVRALPAAPLLAVDGPQVAV